MGISPSNYFSNGLTAGAVGLENYGITLKTKPGTADYKIITGGNTFNSIYDPMLMIGYNVAASGVKGVAAEPYFYLQMEANYTPASKRMLEYHLNFQTSNGNGTYRPFGFYYEDNSTLASAIGQAYFYIGGSNDSQFSVFPAANYPNLTGQLFGVNYQGDVTVGRQLVMLPYADAGLSLTGAILYRTTEGPFHFAGNGAAYVSIDRTGSYGRIYFNNDTGTAIYANAAASLRTDATLLVNNSIRIVNKLRTDPQASQTVAAGTAFTYSQSVLQLTATANTTMTAAPTIADGAAGDRLLLINIGSTYNIVIQDQGTLASSNLRLAASTITIGPRQSVQLMFSSAINDWVQIGPLVTVI